MSTSLIRHATSADLSAIFALLEEESLPVAGVEDHLRNFFVAENDGKIVGAIGLELYGTTGLLRSAVVSKPAQGKRLGTRLYETAVSSARSHSINRLLLLTNTAETYFQRKGFKTIDQQSVTGPVTTSVEFSGACPSHAVCMELLL